MDISIEDNKSGIITAIGEGARIKFIIPPKILANSPIMIADNKIRCSIGNFSFSAKM